MASELSCWVVTDGKAGMESQCLGLAERLGAKATIKRVGWRTPWRQVTPYVRVFTRQGFTRDSDPLVPPWPDLLIATGRHSVAASLYVRRESRRNSARGTFTVQVQNPTIAPSHFDLVITPRHDRLEGANVVSIRGALHRVTPAILQDGARKFASRIAGLKRPYIGVSLGGANAVYRLDPEDMRALARALKVAAAASGGSLIVTPSRRTGAAALEILRDEIRDVPHFLWDGSGENPYFGILGSAEILVVTSDSVNMVSEALATGKPVYVADLPGGSPKFERFHRALREDGATRVFQGSLAPYAGQPIDDMGEAVRAVQRAIRRHQGLE